MIDFSNWPTGDTTEKESVYLSLRISELAREKINKYAASRGMSVDAAVVEVFENLQ